MNSKAVLIAFWRLFWALAFYPIIIGLMIWIYVKDHHWIWGAAVLAAVFVFDPIWRLIARRVMKWRPHKRP